MKDRHYHKEGRAFSLRGGVRALSFIVAAIMIFVVLSCKPGRGATIESITLATVLQEGSIPLFVAEDQGYFRQNGIDMTMRFFDTGADAVGQMVNGQADLAASASDFVMVNQVLNAVDISTIACFDLLDYEHVVARKDRGISSVSDLKGKRIGYLKGTSIEFFLGRFLTLNGLTTKDVTMVDLPSLSESGDALINGDVDAAVLVSPYSEDVVNRLASNVVSWPAQGGQRIFSLAMCKNEWLDTHPGIVKGFLGAIDRAEEYIVRHPEHAKAIAKERLNATDDRIARIWSENRFSLSLDQSLVTAMEDEARWMIDNGLTESSEIPDFTDYIYDEALKMIDPDMVNIIRIGDTKD